MSNVLIGIIGVILFIGLALAGALILGDDFKSSKSSTRAATIAGQMQQVSAAVAMYQLKTGRTMSAATYSTNVASLVPRFLKTAPTSPSGRLYDTVDATGYGADVPVRYVTTTIDPDDLTFARSVCIALNEQAGVADPVAAMGPVLRPEDWGPFVAGKGRLGCLQFEPGGTRYAAYLML